MNKIKTKTMKIAMILLCVFSFSVVYAQNTSEKVTVTGTVTDDQGEPILGVAVMQKNNKKVGTETDASGKYTLTVDANSTLVFYSMVMEQQEMPLKRGVTVYNVKMKLIDNFLDEVQVVSTGIFERDKVSFTGSVSSFSGTEIRNIGNQNILQSLRTLDPSFVSLENLDAGSNPNVMANIELRGGSVPTLNAITDEYTTNPNQPLFVLDGVEVPIERVYDLDINRVASLVILKDAGSTAIYGSRGANGVVVIETIKPKSGKFKIYYSADLQLSAPDLTVYNLMNSAEKLEFDRLSGRYTVEMAANPTIEQGLKQKALNELYMARKAEVERGVDTYWLREPVRTGFTNGHSLRVTGGDKALSVTVGVNYKNIQGVMKGSDRESWSGDISLAYRTKKIVVSNSLNIYGNSGNNSSYGSFRTWAETNPYYRKADEEGIVTKYLQEKVSYKDPNNAELVIQDIIYNPLYNALLNSIDKFNGLGFTNSLQAQYDLTSNIRFKTGIDLSMGRNNNVVFTPPEHTSFEAYELSKKGTYSESSGKNTNYKVYLNGTFAHSFNEIHNITGNIRGEIRGSNNSSSGYAAEGFPFGSYGTPNLANAYKSESKPSYSEKIRRGVGVVATFNYNYNLKYLFDFSYRLDGATTFGSNELYKSFWSVGAGWNIDREAFAEDWTWLDRLKLRTSYGLSGNQNLGSVVSKSVYNILLESNIFGQGYYLSQFANPNLPWQTVKDLTAGIELGLLKGRLNLTFEVYRKKTDPLIMAVAQAPSTGLSSYSTDLGHLINKGFDWRLTFSPIRKTKERIILTLSLNGAHNIGTYGGFDNKLDDLNESLRKGNTMQQYKDGAKSNDIWAVKSYGIDPATGEEVFIKKDGSLSYIYDADDQVVVGSSRPDLYGTFGFNFRYKNFYLSTHFRYSYGGEIFNNVLYNKVENITQSALNKNQDKRALYSRWKNPGDISEFKSISMNASSTRMSSRFVQKDNYIRFESASLSYDLINKPWLKQNLGIETLTFKLYTSDILRWETSKTERGLDYPFARSFSFAVNLSF